MTKEVVTKEERARLEAVTGSVHHIESFGAVDGPGIRLVVFMQGCPLSCLYCHNPDAICVKGGTIKTAASIAGEAERYRRFIRTGGVTFSGGEPLMQAGFITAAATLLKERGVHTALDTSGAVSPELSVAKAAIDACDLILLDIKAADDDTALTLTGSDVKNAFKTLEYCERTRKPVWIRHVLVEGYTLNPAHTEALGRRIKDYRCIERVELLPFHKLGEPKWQGLATPYRLYDTPATTKRQTEEAKKILLAFGLPVF